MGTAPEAEAADAVRKKERRGRYLCLADAEQVTEERENALEEAADAAQEIRAEAALTGPLTAGTSGAAGLTATSSPTRMMSGSGMSV